MVKGATRPRALVKRGEVEEGSAFEIAVLDALDSPSESREEEEVKGEAECREAQAGPAPAAEEHAPLPVPELVQEALEKARTEGFEKGLREGRELAREEVERAKAAAAEIIEEAKRKASEEMQAVVHAAGLRVVGLALEIANKVIQEEVSLRPAVVLKLASAALSRTAPEEPVVIRANPRDALFLQEQADALAKEGGGYREIQIEEDPSIGKGGLVVQTSTQKVDCTIDTQLSEIAQTLSSASFAEV